MRNGKVYLVGAGPGDPDLITVKGLDCIKSADVIIYDRLVDKRLLCHAAVNSELIYVGKFPGGPERIQDEINKLLVDKQTLGTALFDLKVEILSYSAEEVKRLKSFTMQEYLLKLYLESLQPSQPHHMLEYHLLTEIYLLHSQ